MLAIQSKSTLERREEKIHALQLHNNLFSSSNNFLERENN